MPGPAVRCPACGHALFTFDEPAWPGPASPEPPPARGEPVPIGRLQLRVAEAARGAGDLAPSTLRLVDLTGVSA